MNRRRRSHGGSSRGGSSRDYPRTARVNELLREIIGDELERLDDPQLEWVSITGVTVNPELTSAMVFFSSLDGAESDPAVLAALGDRRVRLQAAIARQARLRRTPELHFQPDTGIRDGLKVEEILREIGPIDPDQIEVPDEADLVEDRDAGSDAGHGHPGHGDADGADGGEQVDGEDEGGSASGARG